MIVSFENGTATQSIVPIWKEAHSQNSDCTTIGVLLWQEHNP